MTHRILLADDSATIRKVVELTFSDEDFALDSVGDGALAFEHARATRPDIVISDVGMPGLNGYELCQRFKTDPDLQSVPFLLLKGAFESFDEEKARSCGADGFIVKPFESQEMIAKVKDLIEKSATAPAPGPQSVAPRPLLQQRPAPAPPIPPWPTRPVPATPQMAPPPLQPTPPTQQPSPPAAAPAMVHPPSPTPPPLPAPPAPPAPPAAVKAPVDDFGFDFGDVEDDRPSALAAQPSVPKGAGPQADSSGEADEDLWSEVSLRGNTGDFLEGRGRADSGVESGADIVDLMEEAALIAPEVLFEDETAFEEVPTAREVPLETTVAPPAAPVCVDQDQIERIVSARVEAALRQILEPIVGDLARTMIESVAWEVIPDLAEAMIRAEIERVRQATRTN